MFYILLQFATLAVDWQAEISDILGNQFTTFVKNFSTPGFRQNIGGFVTGCIHKACNDGENSVSKLLFSFWCLSTRWKGVSMVAYEFYWRDVITGCHQLVGIIPERRRNPERVDRESIVNLGKLIIGDDIDAKNILFITVTIDKTGAISYSNPKSGF